MSQDNEVKDVNEVFENLLFAEEVAQESAYKEGYTAGKNQPVEGYHLGYHRASMIAAQLGYYSGVLEQYLQTHKDIPPKLTTLGNTLLDDINKFPRKNVEDVDIMETLQNIKLKYAKFCSLAKISAVYPEADKLNF